MASTGGRSGSAGGMAAPDPQDNAVVRAAIHPSIGVAVLSAGPTPRVPVGKWDFAVHGPGCTWRAGAGTSSRPSLTRLSPRTSTASPSGPTSTRSGKGCRWIRCWRKPPGTGSSPPLRDGSADIWSAGSRRSAIGCAATQRHRTRAASNSLVSLCRAVFGRRDAPINASAAAAARYIAGASVTPVRETSQAATSGVVPPSRAIPAL